MCKRGNELVVDIPSSIELRYNSPNKELRSTVCIDECIVDLIKDLWGKGIKTTGCCCGHFGTLPAQIGVEKEFIKQMKELGYTNDFINSPGRLDIFKIETK